MKLTAWRIRPSAIPIKWKLTMWSALLLFLLFTAYSTIQYFYLERSMIAQEQQSMQKSMNQILNFILERETDFGEQDIPFIQDYLSKVMQKNQMVRISTLQDSKTFSVNTGVIPELIEQKMVAESQWDTSSEPTVLILRSPFSIFQAKGTVELVSSIAETQAMTNALLKIMIPFGLAAILISILGGRLIAGQLLRPLQGITATISKIRNNGLNERVTVVNRNDEIASLSKQFNDMMDQLEKVFHQQSRFVQDASHELRTPIAIMEGHLALLRRWGKKDPDVLNESLDITFDELGRLKKLTQDLLFLSQVEVEGGTAVQVQEEHSSPLLVCEHIIQQLSIIHPSNRFVLTFKQLERVTVPVPEETFRQIVVILLDNAVKYSAPESTVTISGVVRDHSCILEIEDAGIGIPEESLPFVMDRFYRVDKARGREKEGYGLGLPIAQGLVERYKGTISIYSELGKGTKVKLTFPLSDTKGKDI